MAITKIGNRLLKTAFDTKSFSTGDFSIGDIKVQSFMKDKNLINNTKKKKLLLIKNFYYQGWPLGLL